MPNINDINGVTVANLAKLDAVLKANISKVNGLTLVVGAFLLDTYTGAAAAYSTRKLKTGATVAARIRRSGDDIEADVEFDSNNEISLTSPISNASSGTYTDLADFVDHSTTPRNAFCVEWKDQSGNGNDAIQPTAGGSGLQPKLYDATTGLITENGKAALQFDGSNDQLDFAATWNANFYYSVFAVRQGTANIFIGSPDTNTYYADVGITSATNETLQNGFNGLNQTNDWTIYRKNGAAAFTTATSRTEYKTAFYDGNQVLMSFLTAGSPYALAQFTSLRIGGYESAGYNYNGVAQEFIMYQSTTGNQSSNASGIEGNMNSEYLIYQPTDAPTSGLLATYTGAAAAYSVRQLSDKAVIAMRIRRDSDDEERNIGFDSNGDLATADISAFCGTANGYVVEWADQSTNGNHATQSTGTNQPQIYNGTAVITKNGKPGLSFNQDILNLSSQISFTGNVHFQSVAEYKTNRFLYGGPSGHFLQVEGLPATGTMSYRGFGVDVFGIPTYTADEQSTQTVARDASDTCRIYYKGTLLDTELNRTATTYFDRIGNGNGATAGSYDGIFQEMIVWAIDQTSNRTGIESNQNTYFSIY